MQLSKRMLAVASMVTAGYTVADIGTDHAYIPIYLIEKGIIPSAIAADINEGPLRRAEENIKASGLSDKIELRLSDGLNAFKSGEADCLVISGMGGMLMMRILADAFETACGFKECILQPQSYVPEVRAFLLERGFFFLEEDMALDGGKFYPMMKVRQARCPAEKEEWGEAQTCYGKLLLESKNPVLKMFLEKEIALKEKIMADLETIEGPKPQKRRMELAKELEPARKGMEYYAL